jgi:hypothetical protein
MFFCDLRYNCKFFEFLLEKTKSLGPYNVTDTKKPGIAAILGL